MEKMYLLADCLVNADALATEVVDAWGRAFSKDRGDAEMPADFMVLLDTACSYQSMRRENDLRREQFDHVDAQYVANENATRELFCKAWVGYHTARAKARQHGS